MISTTRIAKRYAAALLELVNESKNPEAMIRDLALVQQAINESRELSRLLKSPIVSKQKKHTVVAEIFKSKIGNIVMHYLALVVSKGREAALEEMLEQFFLLRDEQLGIVNVEVQSAVEFSSRQEKELAKHLETFTRKKVRVNFSIDTSLKGGFVARIGDTMVDGSVRHQLELLRDRLKNGAVNN
ncbi:MAG: F0F1 ATP synthase subunit delta [Bacteroidota bacterium]|nr:F0F1 ATP synthase subunit delta [Bacteroidota bacterium]